MKKTLTFLLLLSLIALKALPQNSRATLNLMPVPSLVELRNGKLCLDASFSIAITGHPDTRIYGAANRMLRRLDMRTGLFFKQGIIVPEKNPSNAVLTINAAHSGKTILHEDESYHLVITPEQISIAAENDLGALHAMETLLQLLSCDSNGYFFPACEITDHPRFAWRGLMIDAARHFMPVEVIKRNLDGLAAVKMNVLHLHLSDDQGFRVESKKYPKLTAFASDGLFYTQEQIKEIIGYADDRGIRIVPEFDIPGHATSWCVAYPDLASAPGPYTLERNAGIFDPTINPTLESTYTFLETLFDEFCPLFKDDFFHIGGDENEGKHWNANVDIQAFMKKNNIPDNHSLQAYFNQKLFKVLTKNGKTMMGWDEIMHPLLPKSAVIQSWRGKEGIGQAVKNGYNVLLSNGYYIDLMQPTNEHYVVDPLPAELALTDNQKKLVLGGEATIWSELVTPATVDSRIWPRTAAIAERLWSSPDITDIDDMYRRLEPTSLRLEELGLSHLNHQDVILRNLSNGLEISALKEFVSLIEPLKMYTRNPDGTKYKSYSPLSLLADAATADAKKARQFRNTVDQWVKDPSKNNADKIRSELKRWAELDAEMQVLYANSPILKKETSKMVAALSVLSIKGLEALNMAEQKLKSDAKWQKECGKWIGEAKVPAGQTDLMVLPAFIKLFEAVK